MPDSGRDAALPSSPSAHPTTSSSPPPTCPEGNILGGDEMTFAGAGEGDGSDRSFDEEAFLPYGFRRCQSEGNLVENKLQVMQICII